jgi:hypothetical protein
MTFSGWALVCPISNILFFNLVVKRTLVTSNLGTGMAEDAVGVMRQLEQGRSRNLICSRVLLVAVCCRDFFPKSLSYKYW